MNMHEYVEKYLRETVEIAQTLDREQLMKMLSALQEVKDTNGRLFILGVGGSAANASHAVNDFRKIARMETYAPTDNVSEITARTNDEGWETVFEEYLKISHICAEDAVLVLSVGGGSASTSRNLINAINYAKNQGATILSIVSRDGGYARTMSDACVLIPVLDEGRITPHAEGWQGIVWHLLVNAIQ